MNEETIFTEALKRADMANINGTLFFSSNGSGLGYELWKNNGTAAGIVLVKDINSAGNSDPQWLTNVNGVHGRELGQSDGTSAGTVLVQDINSGSAASDPQDLVAMNNKLYFSADDGVHGRELWDPPPVSGYTLGPLVQVSGPARSPPPIHPSLTPRPSRPSRSTRPTRTTSWPSGFRMLPQVSWPGSASTAAVAGSRW